MIMNFQCFYEVFANIRAGIMYVLRSGSRGLAQLTNSTYYSKLRDQRLIDDSTLDGNYLPLWVQYRCSTESGVHQCEIVI
jgi:hypothetical protein